MNLIQAVTLGLQEVGITPPALLAQGTGTDSQQCFAIAQATALNLLSEWDWEALETAYIWTVQSQTLTGSTTAGSPLVTLTSSPSGIDSTWQVVGTGMPQDVYVVSVVGPLVTLNQNATATNASVSLTFGKTKYSMPSDFSRLINRTSYDKSRRWSMLGPCTAQEWQWLKSSFISTGPRIRYRITGGYLQTWPIIGTGDTLGFEYVSKNYAIDQTTGLSKPAFTADTDTYIWDDRLFITAFKLRYMLQRGLDADEALADYKMQLDRAKAFDKGAGTLSMSPRGQDLLLNLNNVPDSGYGQ